MTEFTDDEKALIDATQWPKTEEDATADALIVHGARLALAMRAKTDVLMREAFSIDRDSPEYKTAISAYIDSITSMIAEAQIVLALVEVQKASREQADALARLLWDLTEDGGVLPKLMWDALSARGIDADAVWALADKSAAPESEGQGA